MAKKTVVSQRTFIDPSKVGTRRSANAGPSTYVGTKDAEWTCNSCGHGPIKGNVKICPTCGNPKDKTETYTSPSNDSPFLSKKEMSDHGVDLDHGSDEECPYCQARIAPKTQICPQCGGNVIDVGKTDRVCPNCHRETNDRVCISCGDNTISKTNRSTDSTPFIPSDLHVVSGSISWLAIVAPIVAIGLLIFGLVVIFSPKEKVGIVTANSWNCTVPVDNYQYNQHSDWSIPAGGDYVSETKAIHHYDPVYIRTDHVCNDEWEIVGSHTETTTEQVCETNQEYTGTTETCYDDGTCDYVDNYDYVTECHDEPSTEVVYDYDWVEHCHDNDVYDQVPVYQPQYTYNIWEWTALAPLETSGTDNQIVCPVVNSTDTYRQSGSESVSCQTTFTVDNKKSYTEKPDCQNIFPLYSYGSQWLLTLSGPIIKSVEPLP